MDCFASVHDGVCRPLAPGTYIVTAISPGFEPQTTSVVVPATGAGIAHDFLLTALANNVTLFTPATPFDRVAFNAVEENKKKCGCLLLGM
jgi:hypothetical protein